MAAINTAPEATSVAERNRLVRQNILKKITVPNSARVDIKPVGANRFRVNVWAETESKTESGFFKEKRIEQSFYHVET